MLNIVTSPTLQQPVAVTEDYMLLPIEDGFSWTDCFSEIENGEWYLVAFRCKHRPDADEELLTQLDRAASLVAEATPGFFYYFAGIPRVTGECLSFCLWDSPSSARAGSSHPDHRKAMEIGVKHYEYYTLERHRIQKTYGELTFTRL